MSGTIQPFKSLSSFTEEESKRIINQFHDERVRKEVKSSLDFHLGELLDLSNSKIGLKELKMEIKRIVMEMRKRN